MSAHSVQETLAAIDRLQAWLDAEDGSHFGQHEKDIEAALAVARKAVEMEYALLAIADPRGRFSRRSKEFPSSEHAMRALKAFARHAILGDDA